jgi:hypothetical protein
VLMHHSQRAAAPGLCSAHRDFHDLLLSPSSRHIFIGFFVGGCVNQVEINRDLYYARVQFRAWLGRGRAVRTGGFLLVI